MSSATDASGHPADPAPAAAIAGWISRSGVIAILVVSPLALGSNRDWGWSPLALLVAISLLALALYAFLARERGFPTRRIPYFSAVAMAGVVGWAVVQTFYVTTGPTLAENAPTFRTDEVAVTALMRLLTYCGMFWLALQLCRHSHFANIVCWAIVATAVAVTVAGYLMQRGDYDCYVWSIKKIGDVCQHSGTFINSGNYATYAGLAALVCLAKIHGLLASVEPRRATARQRWRARLARLTGSGAPLAAALLIIVSGLVTSASKAGFFAFLVAAAALGLTMAGLAKHGGRRFVWPVLSLLVLVVLTLMVSGEALMGRLLGLLVGGGDTDRQLLFAMAVEAISLEPVIGWGLGTFPSIYSLFQTPPLTPIYDKVHNVYLETAFELGIPAALAFIAAIGALAARCLKGIADRGRNIEYPALGFAATVLVGLHSLVDFGVQIPAITILYTTLLGMGWVQSFGSERS